MNRDTAMLVASFVGALLIFGLMVAVGIHPDNFNGRH